METTNYIVYWGYRRIMEKKMETTIMGNRVVSQNWATPIYIPKYDSPYHWDPKMVPLMLGNPKTDISLYNPTYSF